MKPDRKKGTSTNSSASQTRGAEAEPVAGGAAIPVWIFVVLAGMLFWGMTYLDNHAGGFNQKVYQRFASSNELVSLIPYDPVRDKFLKGYAVYNRPTCAACHQANGMGTPGQFPPLAGADWVLESDPGRIIRIVLDGVSGPMNVNGVAYNNVMPPWRSTLNDEEVAQVLTYARTAWNNSASPVTTEQVAAIRKETASRTTPWTAAELEQIALKK